MSSEPESESSSSSSQGQVNCVPGELTLLECTEDWYREFT